MPTHEQGIPFPEQELTDPFLQAQGIIDEVVSFMGQLPEDLKEGENTANFGGKDKGGILYMSHDWTESITLSSGSRPGFSEDAVEIFVVARQTFDPNTGDEIRSGHYSFTQPATGRRFSNTPEAKSKIEEFLTKKTPPQT